VTATITPTRPPAPTVTDTDSADMLAAALGYARAGLPVFPLRPRSKAPLISTDAGGRGFHDATTDPAQIQQWWTDVPHANIGIRPPTGVLVVDVDPRAGGDLELRRILNRCGPLPATLAAKTGSGGWHLWFTAPERDLTEIRTQLVRGVDLKTHSKGYLVAPPSVHPNGTRYRWVTQPHAAPAKAPLWLRQAIQPPRLPALPAASAPTAETSGRYTLQCLVARISTAPEGRRNVILYGALKDALRDGNLDAFEGALLQAAASRGLTAREIAATVASVRRGAAGPARV
jgi:hypothetical protein